MQKNGVSLKEGVTHKLQEVLHNLELEEQTLLRQMDDKSAELTLLFKLLNKSTTEEVALKLKIKRRKKEISD